MEQSENQRYASDQKENCFTQTHTKKNKCMYLLGHHIYTDGHSNMLVAVYDSACDSSEPPFSTRAELASWPDTELAHQVPGTTPAALPMS